MSDALAPNGVINVLKPPGMTSNGVVVFLRHILGTRRVGHTGTLDPGAAGVLPICVGRSTRLCDHIMAHRKTYLAEICFGAATDTQDAFGTIISTSGVVPTEAALADALRSLTGEIDQIPPLYSAVRVDGQRLYKLAYKGKTDVEIPSRRVVVYSAQIAERTAENRFLVRIECGKGTYIRTLLADAAALCGSVAHTSFLLREACGGYSVNDAYTLDELKSLAAVGDTGFLLPPDSALAELPAFDCPAEYAARIENGVPLPLTLEADSRVYLSGEFIGVGSNTPDGMKIKILLR